MIQKRIKFRNKKRKLHYTTQNSYIQQPKADVQHLDFCLEEKQQTQQAKNQLRKFSQAQYSIEEYKQPKATWQRDSVDAPRQWSDGMNENPIQITLWNKSKNNSCSNILKNLQSQKEKDQFFNEIKLLTTKKKNQDIEQPNKNIIKQKVLSADPKNEGDYVIQTQFDVNQCEKSKQKKPLSRAVTIHILPSKKENGLQDLSQNYKKNYWNRNNLQKCIRLRKNVQTSSQIKRGSKIIKISPEIIIVNQNKINDFQQSDSKLQQCLLSTTYLKFKASEALELQKKCSGRAIKTHQNERITNFHSTKSKFYIKNINTICVGQKKIEEKNKSLSSINYKSLHTYKNFNFFQKVKDGSSQAFSQKNKAQQSKKQFQLKPIIDKVELRQKAKSILLRKQYERIRKLMKKQNKTKTQQEPQDLPIQICEIKNPNTEY